MKQTINFSEGQPFESRVGEDTVALLRFQYDPEAIVIVKAIIADHRDEYPRGKAFYAGGWLPDRKMWFVEWPLVDALVAEFRSCGYGVRLPYDAPNESTQRPPSIEDAMLRELGLLPGAPEALIQGAYRALAKLHHPDMGGDTERMKRINQAYEWLCGQRRAAS